MPTSTDLNKPALQIKNFKGLHTAVDQTQIADAELIIARNVVYTKDGVLRTRGGLRLAAMGDYMDVEVEDTGANTGLGFTFFMGIVYPSRPEFEHIWVFACGDGGDAFPLSGQVDRRVRIGAGGFGEALTGDPTGTAELGILVIPPNGAGCCAQDDALSSVSRGVLFYDKLYMSDATFLNYDSSGNIFLNCEAAMPSFRVAAMATHKERIFTAAKFDPVNPGRVWYCEPGDSTTWPSTNFFTVDAGGGGEICRLVNFRDSLYIFKNNAVYVLYTSGTESSWALRKLTDVGCVGELAWEYGNSLYWIGFNGIYRYDGSGVTRLSDKVQDFFDIEGISDGRKGPLDFDDVTGTGFDYDLICRGDIYDDTIIFWVLNPDHTKRIFSYNIKFDAFSELVIDGMENQAVTDIFAVHTPHYPSTFGGIKAGFYFTIANFRGRFPAVYSYQPTCPQDQRIWYSDITTGSTDDTITTNLPITEDLTGKYITIYQDSEIYPAVTWNQTRTIIDQTGTGPVDIQVDSDWDTNPIAASSHFVIWEKFDFEIEVKTKLFDFGNPNTAKRVKKVSFDLTTPGMDVVQYMTPGSGAIFRVDHIAWKSDLTTVPLMGLGKIKSWQLAISQSTSVVSDDPTVPFPTLERFAIYSLTIWAQEHGRFNAETGQGVTDFF